MSETLPDDVADRLMGEMFQTPEVRDMLRAWGARPALGLTWPAPHPRVLPRLAAWMSVTVPGAALNLALLRTLGPGPALVGILACTAGSWLLLDPPARAAVARLARSAGR